MTLLADALNKQNAALEVKTSEKRKILGQLLTEKQKVTRLEQEVETLQKQRVLTFLREEKLKYRNLKKNFDILQEDYRRLKRSREEVHKELVELKKRRNSNTTSWAIDINSHHSQ